MGGRLSPGNYSPAGVQRGMSDQISSCDDFPRFARLCCIMFRSPEEGTMMTLCSGVVVSRSSSFFAYSRDDGPEARPMIGYAIFGYVFCAMFLVAMEDGVVYCTSACPPGAGNSGCVQLAIALRET